MTLALFEDRGTPLEKQRFTWRELVQPPISKLDDDTFTRVRIILLNGPVTDDSAGTIIAQTLWASLLILTGSGNALITYTGFSITLFLGVAVFALFVLRRAQGRLAELEDTVGRSTHEYPALLRFRCARAHLYAELGREGDARAAVDSLLSRDLGQEHLDTEWLFSVSLLPDPCAFLGDEEAAATLYPLLLRYEHVYALAPIEAVFGSLARGLGVLATTLRRFDEAERHFEVAIETERRMRSRPWLAHAQHDLAAMLLARGAADDRERAHALLEEVAAAYRELGMPTWASRATALA